MLKSEMYMFFMQYEKTVLKYGVNIKPSGGLKE